MDQVRPTFHKPIFLAFVVCSLIAIFYLPTLVPQPPTASDSYIFGYNNRAGVVILMLLVMIGAAWTRGLNLQFSRSGNSRPVPLKVLALSLIAVLCGSVAMYMFAGRFGGFGESSYGIDRAWLLSQGKTPYVDFEFAYGISFLYGPVLLQRLLSISIAQAYYLFWIFNFLLGTFILFKIINMVDYPTNSKQSIFLLLYIPGFFSILSMGTNYTFLRYLCPLFFILVVQKLFKGSCDRSRVGVALLAVAFTFILILISPETAIAHAFACVCIFLFSTPERSGRSVATFAGLLLALAAILLAALKLHALDTLKADGGGADSFPISFAPHILLFFASLFICACYVFRRFSERNIDDNTIGLIAFSVPMVAAALGRCDAGHVFWNGQGIFLASMFYVSDHRTAWKWYKAAFVAFMICLPVLTGLLLYMSSIEKVVHPNAPGESGSSTSNRVDLTNIYPSWQGQFLAPFGFKPNGLGTYLSTRVDYGHFEAFVNENSVDAIHEQLAEIKGHPEKGLLLQDHFERYCQINLPAEKMVISVLFAFPYFGSAVHPESIRRPVCDYILANYRLEQQPTPQNFEYGLWAAKSFDVRGRTPHP